MKKITFISLALIVGMLVLWFFLSKKQKQYILNEELRIGV